MLQFDQPSLATSLTEEKNEDLHLVNNNNNNNSSKESTTNSPGVAPPAGTGTAPLGHSGDTPSSFNNMSGGGGGGGGGGGTTTSSNITAALQAPTAGGSELLSSPTSGGGPNGSVVKQCAGCGAKILDRFLLHAMDRYWHTGCLKCSCCQAQLGEIGTSCFAKSGMILCKNDYIRLFGSSGMCATCNQSIPASEFVMRAQNNVYHMNCFTCFACHSRLVPGDRFTLVNGSLVCEHDYPKFVRSHASVPLRSSHKVC